MMARYGVRVLPPETTDTGGTTPTAGQADPVEIQEARVADAAAREETTAAREGPAAARETTAAAAAAEAVGPHPTPPGRESRRPAASSSCRSANGTAAPRPVTPVAT